MREAGSSVHHGVLRMSVILVKLLFLPVVLSLWHFIETNPKETHPEGVLEIVQANSRGYGVHARSQYLFCYCLEMLHRDLKP